MRVALTILLNGLHHLKHKEYFKTVSNIFNKWVIVEGVALPGGSTSWCNNISDEFHTDYLSSDGTSEFLDKIKSDKIAVLRPESGKPWKSKDEQVNVGIDYIKSITSNCYLWQIDIDEQWSLSQIQEAERLLTDHGGKTGCFRCNYYVGPHQQVFGEWGEAINDCYRRLWRWSGERFKTHEPPQLDGRNGPGLILPQRFNHYAYYFDQDVRFKEKYYGGYAGLYDRWLKIQQNRGIKHVRELLGDKLRWSYSDTHIHYINGS